MVPAMRAPYLLGFEYVVLMMILNELGLTLSAKALVLLFTWS